MSNDPEGYNSPHENMPHTPPAKGSPPLGACQWLRQLVHDRLTPPELAWTKAHVGFADCAWAQPTLRLAEGHFFIRNGNLTERTAYCMLPRPFSRSSFLRIWIQISDKEFPPGPQHGERFFCKETFTRSNLRLPLFKWYFGFLFSIMGGFLTDEEGISPKTHPGF